MNLRGRVRRADLELSGTLAGDKTRDEVWESVHGRRGRVFAGG